MDLEQEPESDPERDGGHLAWLIESAQRREWRKAQKRKRHPEDWAGLDPDPAA